jgi:hypothetical protein
MGSEIATRRAVMPHLDDERARELCRALAALGDC